MAELPVKDKSPVPVVLTRESGLNRIPTTPLAVELQAVPFIESVPLPVETALDEMQTPESVPVPLPPRPVTVRLPLPVVFTFELEIKTTPVVLAPVP